MRDKEKIETLVSKILYHKKLYYTGKSILSDFEYDELEHSLRKLMPNHPVLSLVGYEFKNSNKKISRIVPMLSLSKTYLEKDLFNFLQKGACVIMDKVDGMALSIEYNDKGDFMKASTRGNGRQGEDVSEHIYHVVNIPKKIQLENHNQKYQYEIRGELYFPLSEFKKFEHRFESFRNAVPGTLGRKEIEAAIDVLRILKFCVYDILIFSQKDPDLSKQKLSKNLTTFEDYFEKIHFCKKIGFQNHDHDIQKVPVFENVQNLKIFLDRWYAKNRDYQIDGVVFRLQDEVLWEKLGNTAHHPRGSLAYKKAGESAVTKIEEIETSLGRSGKITFRAKLSPVYLSGAKISYATLHNAEFIEQGGYGKGAEVEIIRSGEVIPTITKLVKSSHLKYSLPQKCFCHYSLVRRGPELFCAESRQCVYKDQESLVYFVSVLNIVGISDKIVFKMRSCGLVKEPADFFKITADDLLQIDGFKTKSAKNFLDAFQKAKNVSLGIFLTALGLQRGGPVKCQEIANKYKTLEKVLSLTPTDLISEKGWALKSAENFLSSLNQKKQIIENLLKYVNISEENQPGRAQKQKNDPYFGKQICITGALSRPRQEYKKLIESQGAKLASAVSSQTDYLICNEQSESAKYKDAKKYGIKIITETEFKRLLLKEKDLKK
jgi:DNA ligase (NAD+)